MPQLNVLLLLPCSAPCCLAASTGEGTCVLVATTALLQPGREHLLTPACAPWARHGPGAGTTALPKVWALLPKASPREARLFSHVLERAALQIICRTRWR